MARMVKSTGISEAIMRKFKVVSDIHVFNIHRICTYLVANLSNTPPNRLEGAQALSDELQASVAILPIPTG